MTNSCALGDKCVLPDFYGSQRRRGKASSSIRTDHWHLETNVFILRKRYNDFEYVHSLFFIVQTFKLERLNTPRLIICHPRIEFA
jgi:hypothetical protein